MAGRLLQPVDEGFRQLLRMLDNCIVAWTEDGRQITPSLPVYGEAVGGDVLPPSLDDCLSGVLNPITAGVAIAVIGAAVAEEQ